jgi:UDP:flavonoid glycosyltransferase YjiC (YdhE family)
MRVYIGCFGSGLGHATRMLGVADTLRKRGDGVEFSSSGEVASFIETRGYRCNRLPLADVAYSENGELSLGRTVAASPVILARTYRQIGLELGNMKRFSPDVVLSDSVVSTIVAARLINARAYAILNQLNLSARAGRMRAGTVLLSEGATAGITKLWSLSDRILLPDLPPPYTISESNLRSGRAAGAVFIGFLTETNSRVPDEATEAFKRDPRPKIFWQVSGPPKTRSALVRAAREIASRLSREFAFVLADGDPRGSRRPVEIDGGWEYGWCDAVSLYCSACDFVVSRAGHGSIAQAILSSKPSLLIPIPRQTEQEGNAAKAVRLGVALSLEQDELTLASFREAANQLMTGGYQERVRDLGAIARGYDARSEIVRIIESSA